jgi:hypothetical protein
VLAGTSKAGATGLEPATSGVTGHYEGRQVYDDGCGIALFMRLFRALAEAPVWLWDRRRDVCCPIAAREGMGVRPGLRDGKQYLPGGGYASALRVLLSGPRVEFETDDRFVADDPGVVPGLDHV